VDGWFSDEGSPSPLGVSWFEKEGRFNFALYSKHATHVTLLLYAADDEEHPLQEVSLCPLRNKSGRVWNCRLRAEDIARARYYAYRVDGPNEAGEEHRFDRNKIDDSNRMSMRCTKARSQAESSHAGLFPSVPAISDGV
jgi:isoamylase